MKPEDIDPADIAHALALKCRFTGHCDRFYSVAQHSYLVSQHVPAEYRKEALLHDATEAYLPDVASPLKSSMLIATSFEEPMLFFKEVEERVLDAVLTRFNLRRKLYWPASIKQVDARMLATEKRDLMVRRDDMDWGMVPEHHQPFEHLQIAPWNWASAEEVFRIAMADYGIK